MNALILPNYKEGLLMSAVDPNPPTGSDMSPSRKSLDPQLFQFPLQSFEYIEARLALLRVLSSKDNLVQIIEGLLKASVSPNIAGLFLSYAEPHHHQWLLEHFPSDPKLYRRSLFDELLPPLADFLCFNEFDGVDGRVVAKFRRSVQMAPELLNTLLSLIFQEDDDPDDTLDSFPVRKSKQSMQRKRKQARKLVKSTVAVDDKIFLASNISVPETKKQAELVAVTVLHDLKDILQKFLSLVSLPSVITVLQQPFISTNIKDAPVNNPGLSKSQNISITTESSSTAPPPMADLPVAFPTVQPLKSALHFESVDGFGNWRIIISGRADQDLREARKKDFKSFTIIIKKIKELSRGHFSDDNQKRLTGAGPEFPIFEAKMTRDSRLVYQVDCVDDLDGEAEVQVIRIFGIYTHAQLKHNRFWDSLSRLVGKKGREYRQRCAYRLPQASQGDKVFEPASFPSRDEAEDQSVDPLELPKEDLDELHSLLILGKFITFSRPVFNSILANLDATFPFDLSGREMKIVEHASSCYVLGRSGTGKTTTMLFKMICVEAGHDTLQANTHRPRQLFVTQSRMLATKVGEYFTKLTSSLVLASQSPQQLKTRAQEAAMMQDPGMVDREEEAIDTSNLPSSYSQLREDQFPLFVTYSQLCDLLEADYADKGIARRTGNFVAYDRFLRDYWAHFPQGLTKRLDPALVFSEMMGVIKGSERTLTCPDWSLDASAYKDLGHRAFSTFADNRDAVFDIFLMYTKQKRSNGDYDAADRTHAILNAIRNYGVPGSKIDFLYVDEVQDNLLIDTLVLRSICSNPNGLFWAGDTAQTISVGSSFKFNELKSFLFRIEEKRREEGLPTSEKPKAFQLAINYRSHGGIVNCAHSVVKLITRFWPDSIDTLRPEHGVIDGGKPVFFNGWDKDTVRYEQFLFGESGQPLEFGAHQCIIVRDENAKERLKEQVGNIGIVMTIYESKGLEFNDVLLYNFFEDSTVDLSRWRVVLNALEGQAAPDVEARHISICTELKCLYVSITRARKNVWIADCSDKGEPMRLFWTHHDLIQNCTPNDVPRLAVESTKEEWAKQGRTLFDNRRYFQAKHCYDRASLHREARVAEAYFLRDQARKIPTERTHKADITNRNTAYLLAAERFLQCALDPPDVKNSRQYYLNAADCFEVCDEQRQAAHCYLCAEEFTKACKLYRRVGDFDEAIAIIKGHADGMDSQVAQSILDVARLYYFTSHNLDCVLGVRRCESKVGQELCSLFGKTSDLFPSPEDQLDYLADRDLDLARAKYMALLPGKLAEAAEIHLAEGRSLDAIQLFLRDQDSNTSLRRGYESLLQGLWQHMSFGVLERSNAERDALLDISLAFKSTLATPEERLEMTMFQLIRQHAIHNSMKVTTDLLRLSAELFYAKRLPAALLCLDHCFAPGMYSLDKFETSGLVTFLDHFLRYVKLLHEVALNNDPCRHRGIQRLFGIEVSNENVVYIRHATLLGSTLLHGRYATVQVGEDGILITNAILSQAFRKVLYDRLSTRIHEEETLCSSARALNPCLSYAVFNSCRRPECVEEHLPATAFSKQTYNCRVRIHLLQISILGILDSIEPLANLTRMKGRWIGRLYEALNPPHHVLGTPFAIDTSLIPHAGELLSVARSWIRFLVYNQHHTPDRFFITNLMRNFQLAFVLDRPEAESYVYRTRRLLEGVERLPPDFVRGAGVGHLAPIVVDYIGCLCGNKPWSVSNGILFIRNVIDRKLPIHSSVLCDYTELLCASLVLHNKFNRQADLHGVILPINWLAKSLHVKIWDIPHKLTPFSWFAETVVSWLEPLYLGTLENIFPGSVSRNIVIYRLCRALCFLGWNIRLDALRQVILRGITGLRKAGRQISFLFNNFVSATSWDHLLRALRQSITSRSMDEVVQLVYAKAKPPLGPLPNIRQISHGSGEDLLSLVAHTKLYRPSRLSPSAAPFVPSRPPPADPPQTTIVADPITLSSETTLPALEDLPSESSVPSTTSEVALVADAPAAATIMQEHDLASGEDMDDPATMVEGELAAELEEEQYVTNTDEELRSVRVLQGAFRKWLSRRRKVSKDGSDEALQHFFTASYLVSVKKEWPSRLHRMMFLGPLIHIRLCLEGLHTLTRTLKEKTKSRLKTAQHEELDSLGPRLTLISKTFKSVQELQKTLEPKRILSPDETISSLKETVRRCEELVQAFAQQFSIPRTVLTELETGVKGILKEPPPPKPLEEKPKPSLVFDDEFGYLDSYSMDSDDSGVAEGQDNQVDESSSEGGHSPEVFIF